MQINQTIPKRSRGAVSLTSALLVTILVTGVYLVYKMNTYDDRLKSLEKKIETGATNVAAQQDQNNPVDIAKVKALFKKGNITFGDAKAKLLIAEFADPSCPFCNVAAGVSPEIAESMDPQGKRFFWVSNGGSYVPPVQEIKKLVDDGKASYVNLYANGHGAGEIAAQALYCSYEQGKFWEAHGLLYSKAGYDLINNEVKNDKANISKIVAFLGDAMDSAKIDSCLTSAKYEKKIAEDMTTVQDIGFSGTPMYIVNTQKFPGAYSFTDMKPAIDAALK